MQNLARVFVLALVVAGCINQAKEAIAPTPETPGTLSCREIMDQCDSQCGDPLCLHRCTNEGTQEAQGQHAAMLDCGQRNGCSDAECMEQNCSPEVATCMGSTETPSEAAPSEPAPAGGAPGETPPSS